MTEEDSQPEDILNAAAILCTHVAAGERPIGLAIRTEPIEAKDSGWQFLCNCEVDEDADEAKIWLINEVLAMEPTLAEYINRPPRIELVRTDPLSPWETVENGQAPKNL